MGESWYKHCMPLIDEIKIPIFEFGRNLYSVSGVKGVKLFGSFAQNINSPSFRVKDVDILVVTPFHSGDMIAMNTDILSMKPEIIEEEGYDIRVANFSKYFMKTSEMPLDFWAISSDKKLLHWGPVITDRIESDEVKKEAEEYATNKTGVSSCKIMNASETRRNNWYSSFHTYMKDQLKDMPTGWYCSEVNDIKDILNSSIEIKKPK